MNTSEMPADLAAVQADDVLLDMLGSAGRTPGNVSDVDGELMRVLADWRHEVHADSNQLLVDTDTALAVIYAAAHPPMLWDRFVLIFWWVFMALVGLFAILLIFGG